MSFDTPIRTPIRYHWIDGVERLERYVPGGYHPVMLGDLLHHRYRVVDKLGFGGYSTVWLARDEQSDRFVAVKIGMSGVSALRREIDILKALNDPRSTQAGLVSSAHASIPSILDAFEVHGPNGIHSCYTLPTAQGDLWDASFNDLFPVEVARALAAKLVLAVAFVHSQGFVHGDIRLRNVLVKLPSTFDTQSISEFESDCGEPVTEPISRVDGNSLTSNVPTHAVLPLFLGKKAREFTLDDAHGLILSDFGEAFSPATEQRLGKDCHIPPAGRSPEAVFQPTEPLSYPSDIWSLGTAIWEILGMKFIFSTEEPRDHIAAQQIDVLGYDQFPGRWRKKWERTSEEDEDAEFAIPKRPTEHRDQWPTLENAFEDFVQKYRRKREGSVPFEAEEVQAILDLMRNMLRFRPEERLTIDEVLKSKWMVDWALPQLK